MSYGSGYTPPQNPPKHYAFVDADNVRHEAEKALKNLGFSAEEIEIFDISGLFSGFTRTIAYFAKPENSELPEWIKSLQASSCIVRFGRLAEKGNGARSKQEGVDVLMAIEAMKHAYRRNMERCTIFSKDGVFLPLVDALVAEGIQVKVASFSNPAEGIVVPELRNRADGFRRLGTNDLVKCIPVELRVASTVTVRSPESHPQFNGELDAVSKARDGFTLEQLKSSDQNGLQYICRYRISNGNFGYALFRSIKGFEWWMKLVGPPKEASPGWLNLEERAKARGTSSEVAK